MSAPSIAPSLAFPVDEPDVSSIVTEDGAPVDNIFSERQMRLLTDPLYVAWAGPPPDDDGAARPFVALANVGVFGTPHTPPVVPDVLLAVGVTLAGDVHEKQHRTWFTWVFGKSPDLVIEVVSNREGGELTQKKTKYRDLHVPIYVVWDPEGHLSDEALQCFELRGMLYVRKRERSFPWLGLGLVIWEGSYEGCNARWLRWVDAQGELLPTGSEAKAEAERRAAAAQEQAAAAQEQAAAAQGQAAAAQEQAAAAKEQAAAAQERAERLAAKLRVLGIDPDAA